MWKRRPPWERRTWRKGNLRPSHNGALLLLFGPLLCGGLFWAFRYARTQGAEAIFGIASWLFAILAVGLGVFGAIKAARYLRFSGARLVMLDMPGVIGGSFTARLDLPKPMPRGTTVTVRLVNEKTRAERDSGNKNNSQLTRTMVYEAVTQHDMDEVSFRGGKYAIPVTHEIPEHAKDPRIVEQTVDSFNTNIRVTYDWYLTAKACLPGADLDLRFQVPVYLTDGSIPNGLFSRVTRRGCAEHRLDADGNLTCDIVQPDSQPDGATENSKSEQIAAPLPSEGAPSDGR